MSRKVPPVEIPDDTPFENDVLDREPTAKHLTSLLRTIDDPFVFSVSSPYGTGKTTFVKMWRQHLENEGFVTLYYNAWENDFVDDPMVAFIDEITTRIEGRDALAGDEWQERIATVRSFAGKVARRAVPLGLRIATGGLLDVEDEEMFADAVHDLSGEAIEQYRSMKDDVQEFRDALTELVEEIETEGDGNPIILFVDELDRCRPDHAVLLLERIKHFFSIPGITFVLSMEPDQLQHSVKALYGAEFDAKAYLRRFIDLDFPLPEPARESYTKILFKHHQIDTLQNSVLNQHTYDSLPEMTALLAEEFNFGLRQQQQHALRLAMTYRIVLAQWQMNFETLAFISFLVALRMHDEASFRAFMEGDTNSIESVEKFRAQLHPGLGMGKEDVRLDFDCLLHACLTYWKLANDDIAEADRYYDAVDNRHSDQPRMHFDALSSLFAKPSDFQKMIRVVQITQGMGPFFGDD